MARGLRNPPSPSQINAEYSVNVPNMSYATYEPLYDYQTKTQAATPEQRFFVDPVGTSGKTIADTNMELSGQIPAGQRFVITGIQVELYPDVAINGATASNAFLEDVYEFYRNGALILRIGSIEIIRQGNLMKFAPVNRLSGTAAVGVANDATGAAILHSSQVYGQAAGREYAVNNIELLANQNFSVSLVGGAALSATARVGVTLNGWKYRNAQ
jgi:hypothetical protein